VDNELSEFFGASAMVSSPHDQQSSSSSSSNPWNIPSSTMSNFPTNSGSISPPNTGLTTGGNLLYPTIAGGHSSNPNSISPLTTTTSALRKTPESFLGDNFSNLVNLDKLVTETKTTTNPFGSTAPRAAPNPFANTMKPPTLDQLSSSNNVAFTSGSTLPPPLIPSSYNSNNTTTTQLNTPNPFLLKQKNDFSFFLFLHFFFY
jgi:hypothetical protein